jgi:hypothetical protein
MHRESAEYIWKNTRNTIAQKIREKPLVRKSARYVPVSSLSLPVEANDLHPPSLGKFLRDLFEKDKVSIFSEKLRGNQEINLQGIHIFFSFGLVGLIAWKQGGEGWSNWLYLLWVRGKQKPCLSSSSLWIFSCYCLYTLRVPHLLSALSHTRLPLANRGIFMKNSMGGWNGSLLKELGGNRDFKNVQKIK